MSFPPAPPLNEPNEPNQPKTPSRKNKWTPTRNKWTGAMVATALVLVFSALSGFAGMGLLGWGIGTVVAFLCVVLGSILTIPRETRAFAIGFLIASAILTFVTAGACLAVLSSPSVQL